VLIPQNRRKIIKLQINFILPPNGATNNIWNIIPSYRELVIKFAGRLVPQSFKVLQYQNLKLHSGRPYHTLLGIVSRQGALKIAL
jgi:hypothetical protein